MELRPGYWKFLLAAGIFLALTAFVLGMKFKRS
jgi:hypothetical protein